MSRVAYSATVFVAVIATMAAEDEAHAACDFKPGDAGSVATVTFPAVPITTTHVVFDEDDGEQQIVTLDPETPSAFVHRVYLAKGCWTVTVWAVPETEQKSGVVTFARIEFTKTAADSKVEWESKRQAGIVVEVSFEAKSDSPDADAKARALSLEFSLPPGVRGIDGGLPDALDEVLSILAEVAIERAKSRGLEVIRKRVRKVVCEDLTWSALERPLRRIGAMPINQEPKDIFLTETCAAIDAIRLSDLASSGRELSRALVRDASAVAIKVGTAIVTKHLGGDEEQLAIVAAAAKDLGPIVRAILTAAGQQKIEKLFVDDLVRRLRAVNWQTLFPRDQDAGAVCVAQQLVRCLDEDCDPADAYRKVSGCTATAGFMPDPQRIFELTQKIRSAKEDRERLHALADLTLDIVLRKVCEGNLTGCDPTEWGFLFIVRDVALPLLSGKTGRGKPVNLEGSPFSRVISKLAELVIAIGRADREPRIVSAQLLLQELAYVNWNSVFRDKIAACGMTVAFEVAAYCSRETCGASKISRLLQDPSSVAVDACGKTWKKDRVELATRLPDLELLVADALMVARPATDATAERITGSVVNLVFTVLESALCKDLGASCHQRPELMTLRDVKATITAIVTNDAAAALVALASIMQRGSRIVAGEACKGCDDKRHAVTLAVNVFGAVAAYAATFAKDAGDEKARHEARKRAVESLVDSMTDRSARRGDGILSFGANVGFGMGARSGSVDPASTEDDGWFGPELSLPMGIAYDHVPGDSGWDGLHLQLSLVDLGQFLSRSGIDANVPDPMLDTFLMVGLQVGWYLPGLGREPVLLSLDGRWRPGRGTEHESIFQGSLSLSYYVPFLDLN